MKKLFFICFAALTFSGFSQAPFEINIQRSVIASVTNTNYDSLYADKAEVKIFVPNTASAIELKFYNYVDSTFTLVHNTTTSIVSIPDTPCNSDFCKYMYNPSVVIINLGTKTAEGKYKVYIKVIGTSGIENVIKEIEL